MLRKVWRYQKGNQKKWIKEGQTTQWPKEKGQKDKQWCKQHYTDIIDIQQAHVEKK